MNYYPLSLSFHKAQRLPLILQEESSECAHACIAMIANYHGHQLDLAALRKRSQGAGQGMTLLRIKTILDELGFKSRAVKLSIAELQHLKTPAILHWNLNHFVVLKKVKRNAIVIHDPSSGQRICTMEEVSASYTGIALEALPMDGFVKIVESKKLGLASLLNSAQGVRKYLIMMLLLSFSIEILMLINPLFMQYVTDSVIISGEMNNLLVIAVAFMLLCVISSFAEYSRGNIIIYLSSNLLEQFSSNIMLHLLKLPLDFFERRHKGDIQSKFQSIDQIQRKLGSDFIQTLLDGLMIIFNFLVLFLYSPLLTLIVIGSLTTFVLLRYSSYQLLKRQTEISIRSHAKAVSQFLETLQVMSSLKSFSREGMRFSRWRNAYIHAVNADIRISKFNVLYQTANALLFGLEQLLVICLGAYLVLQNKFSAGMLVAFLSYRLMLVNKSASLIHNLFDYKLIAVQLTRLGDIIFQEPERIESGYGKPDTVKGSLELRNLCFHYNGQEPNILQNINLQIQAGEKVVIIGPSGSGKSTLMKVMMGLLQKSEGEILIDGQRLEDFGLKNYRQITASVLQDEALLSGSILENISFFDEDLDLERVQQVAKLAAIHDTICQLPMAYETQIGEMGSFLSGGQKQRVLLARALYKQPKILFLDEASSHLDEETEKSINGSLKELDITQVIIAHRIETIRLADRVLDFTAL